MISFLELTPRSPTDTFKLDTADGQVDVELRGISLATLAELSKRFPAFGKIIEGGGGSIIDATEAMPALIAAGLGHAGEVEYEIHAGKFGGADMLAMVRVIMRLTLPQSETTPPLSPGDDHALVNGVDERALDPISLSRLSNSSSGSIR